MIPHGKLDMTVLDCVSLAELDVSNRLLAAYLNSEPSAYAFFAVPPTAQTEYIAQLSDSPRPELAQALAVFQRDLDAHTAALDNARQLADPRTLVVTTGQQPGLLTGPFYAITKALTAITLAARLAQETGRPAVPVFWLATDDDDRQEADHCACWDKQYAAQPILYNTDAGEAGSLIGNLPVGLYGDEVLTQIAPLLQGLPGADAIYDLLQNTLQQSRDLGDWCARLLARLLSGYGLVICDPRLPILRRLAMDVLRREIAAPLATTIAVNQQAEKMHAQHFHPQLTKPADTTNFFYLVDGQRRRVRYLDGNYQIDDDCYSQETLQTMLAQSPERFLPNAVLRPVVQEHMFHSAAFITGPNEFNYWAELRKVFAVLQVDMPPVVPRAGITVAPARVARLLREWRCKPLDLLQSYDQVRLRLLQQQAPEATRLAFAGSRQTIEEITQGLSEAVTSVEATLAAPAQVMRQHMLQDVERLERKTLKALERREQELMTRLEFCRETLFPGQGLQERTLCIFALLARYGPQLIEEWRLALDGQEGRHLFVELTLSDARVGALFVS